jgi:hypothetical protein
MGEKQRDRETRQKKRNKNFIENIYLKNNASLTSPLTCHEH